MSRSPARELVEYVTQELAALGDAELARGMAAYMKTAQPFFGVQKPNRVPVFKEAKRRFEPGTMQEYRAHVLALWSQPQRECKYLALNLAAAWKKFVTPESMDLYEHLMVDGAWWDLVDDVSSSLVGEVLRRHPEKTRPFLERWIAGDNLWLARAAIICQRRLRDETDWPRLKRYCLAWAAHEDFFIRKGIGWALREYAKTQPEQVRAFVKTNQKKLSPLTVREATKHLK